MKNNPRLHKWNDADMAAKQTVISLLLMDNKHRILVFDHLKINKLTNPVGKCDPGDTVENTFIKESGEELGIKVEEVVMLGIKVNTYYRKGKTIKIAEHHGLCTKYTGTVKNAEPEKHKNLRWMSLEQIKKQPPEYLSNTLKWLIPWLEKHPDGRP